MIEFCAEIGSNHKGQKALAFEMIRQFALAGADICKFQLGHERWKETEGGVRKDNWIRYAPIEWAEDLKHWCEYWDVEFMASVFSEKGLATALDIGMKRYKIAHQTWEVDRPFAKKILALGKETFVSSRGTKRIEELPDNAKLLYCTRFYPTFPCDLSDVPEKFNDKHRYANYILGDRYGYSSHVFGIADALLAVARGACYIEKHVTLDKTEESIRDNHFAISPQEFAELVRLGKQIHKLL